MYKISGANICKLYYDALLRSTENLINVLTE